MMRQFLIAMILASSNSTPLPTNATDPETGALIPLPQPRRVDEAIIERLLRLRRSVRSFAEEPVSLQDAADMLWAGQGVTSPEGLRTAPSAGGLYPLELYLVSGAVEDLPDGIYRYEPESHGIVLIRQGDHRWDLSKAALGQTWIHAAPFTIVVAGVFDRTAAKYGKRADLYVPLEAGCAVQNMLLIGVSSGLGTVIVGAFEDSAVQQVLQCANRERPLAMVAAGIPSSGRLKP